MNAEDKLTLLRGHSLFGQLPQAALKHLSSYMKRRSLPRGAVIFTKGDPSTGLMGVLAGTVKISVPSAGGRDVVLNIIHEGEIFGEAALLDGCPRTADAAAMTDCVLMVIERRDFIPFLRRHPDLMMKIIEILCARLRRTSEQVQELTFLNLTSSLAKALLQLTDKAQALKSTPKVTITQREISQIIGRSREGTNKQLRVWAKQGIAPLGARCRHGSAARQACQGGRASPRARPLVNCSLPTQRSTNGANRASGRRLESE